MAKLSTPTHECSSTYSDDSGNVHHCPNSAYTRFAGAYLCRPHLRSAKTKAAKTASFWG